MITPPHTAHTNDHLLFFLYPFPIKLHATNQTRKQRFDSKILANRTPNPLNSMKLQKQSVDQPLHALVRRATGWAPPHTSRYSLHVRERERGGRERGGGVGWVTVRGRDTSTSSLVDESGASREVNVTLPVRGAGRGAATGRCGQHRSPLVNIAHWNAWWRGVSCGHLVNLNQGSV